MSVLHGLRLNCLLAPLSVAMVGVMAILVGWWLHTQELDARQAAGDLAVVRGWAQLAEAGVAARPQAWLAAHPDWLALAELRIHDEVVTVVTSAGSVAPPREATSDLLLSYQGARRWRQGGHRLVAAPIIPQAGQPSVLVGWREDPPAAAAWPWLLLAAGVVVVGGGLGAYLVARVYRPVLWCERAAAAAANGTELPGGAPEGPETASLRSSIATLIATRKHSDLADPKPDA